MLAYGQDYLQQADTCFERGDYECAKKNYTHVQVWDTKDVSEQIKKADECLRTLNIANDYFKEKNYKEARTRYKSVLEINPKDPYAKKQYEACGEIVPQFSFSYANLAANCCCISKNICIFVFS